MSKYFRAGAPSEQNLQESLIVECLDFWGTDLYYVPRTLVAKDDILGEDRMSEFKNKYLIRGYLEQIDNFEGQGAFVQKFGLQMEQSGTFTIARKVWADTIGKYGQTILPNRPAEGDLIYWPTNGGLFEIKFVNYQNPFYQLGKLYVYKLEVELFQYGSEHITTGFEDIDKFESTKSFDVAMHPEIPKFIINDSSTQSEQVAIDLNNVQVLNHKEIVHQEYPVQSVIIPSHKGDNAKYNAAAPSIGFNTDNVFGDV